MLHRLCNALGLRSTLTGICIPFETKPFLPSSLSLTLVNEKSERTGNGSDSSRILSIFLRFLPGVVNYMTTRWRLLVQRDGKLV